ncbi:mucin-3A-like [Pyxicephalus adspersus]|uniref:mucin-3A-like n=1 Tax=Pyxicephalus adspersus TaxID=30357 RepID=UPI003B5C36FC
MNSVYYDVPGYKDVIIQEIRNGSIIVNHVVLVEIKYKLDLNILNQYNQMLERVRHLLEQLKTNKCTSAANPLCVDGKSITVTQIPPPSEEELCLDRVPKGNENFYDPVLFPDGLACVSHCDPYSPKHLSCNDGTCQVKSRSVPQCFCARTDLYIYTSLQCTGKISKLGLLIGSGFAIGILFIISIILGIYIYIVRKSMPKPFLTEDLYITTMI